MSWVVFYLEALLEIVVSFWLGLVSGLLACLPPSLHSQRVSNHRCAMFCCRPKYYYSAVVGGATIGLSVLAVDYQLLRFAFCSSEVHRDLRGTLSGEGKVVLRLRNFRLSCQQGPRTHSLFLLVVTRWCVFLCARYMFGSRSEERKNAYKWSTVGKAIP